MNYLELGAGLLQLLANAAGAAGQADAAAALGKALGELVSARARIDAIHAKTDAALVELQRKEQGG